MKAPDYQFPFRSDIDWDSIPDSEAQIIESLPHGSGIDYSWYIEVNTAGKVVAYNAYHGMDENGYYRRSIDFSIRWVPGHFRDFRFMLHGAQNDRYWVEYWDLYNYLPETILYSVEYATS
jgi:hypothetical protein